MKIPYLLFVILVPVCSYSQTSERQVIGSMGSYQTATGISHSYTVGELAIGTGTSPSLIITQGFNQSDNLTTGLNEVIESEFTMSYYPNPTESILNFDFNSEQPVSITLNLFDAGGKTVNIDQETVLVDGMMNYQLNMSRLTSGSYLIRISDSKGEINKTLRIQKIR